jgi:hypothetical protein
MQRGRKKGSTVPRVPLGCAPLVGLDGLPQLRKAAASLIWLVETTHVPCGVSPEDFVIQRLTVLERFARLEPAHQSLLMDTLVFGLDQVSAAKNIGKCARSAANIIPKAWASLAAQELEPIAGEDQ